MSLNPIIDAVINGVMLFLGVFLGAKFSAREIKKQLTSVAEGSETAQKLKRLINDPKFEKDLSKLLSSAAGFFEEAKVLVSGPEAKTFFKKAGELVEQFSSESPEVLTMPKKPQ